MQLQSQLYLDGLCPNEANIPKMFELYYDLDTGKAYRYGRELMPAKNGRIHTTLRNKAAQIAVHLMDWLIEQGAPISNNLVVDHIDSNPLNNCADNLRPITQKQNVERQQVAKNNITGIKRYTFDDRYKQKHLIREYKNGKYKDFHFNTKNQAKRFSKWLDLQIEASISTKTLGDYFDELNLNETIHMNHSTQRETRTHRSCH